jgi:diguanylate cyclase (GGDEF)-like protein/PAS domain S-box-containing protein
MTEKDMSADIAHDNREDQEHPDSAVQSGHGPADRPFDPWGSPHGQLADVLVSELLKTRGSRPPNLESENEFLHSLAQHLLTDPEHILERSVRAVARLCEAGFAGVSLLENHHGEEVFRWVALGGTFEGQEGRSTPRFFSPCGLAFDRQAPQLFSYPARYYTYLRDAVREIVEALVLPLPDGTGTIWIGAHDEAIRFDSEHVRLLTGLATFMATSLKLLRLTHQAQRTRGGTERDLTPPHGCTVAEANSGTGVESTFALALPLPLRADPVERGAANVPTLATRNAGNDLVEAPGLAQAEQQRGATLVNGRTEMNEVLRGHRVLHIGGNSTDARVIRQALSESKGGQYDVEWVGTLSDGVERLTTNPTSAVLLDLQLPDCRGIDGLEKLLETAPAIPILVVGADENEEIARQVIRAGARDYLLTNQLDGYWLPRALRHAIERKLSEDALFAETERVEVTLNSIGDAVLSTDVSGRVTYLNRTAEAMTGWPRAEAAGRPLEEVLQMINCTLEPAVDSIERETLEDQTPNLISSCTLIRRDGSESAIEQSTTPIHDRLGLVAGATIVFRDISAARERSLRMSHLASHDPLTDLPNRLLLGDRLARSLALAQRHRRRLAVLFLDIDRFKHINDSLGHTLGDELLRAVGREVTTCVRSSDTVSRHGGDEFVIVLSELEHAEDAATGAQKIVAALALPRQLAGHELHITVSIGISVFPDDGEDAETLLQCADTALYHAKNQGRDCYQFFKPDLNVRAVERQSIEAGLHSALDKREFELLYQPKMNLKTGAVVGAEALLRWRHPDRGLVEPAQFVPIAEDCGLIKPIGRWVVHEACRQAQAWQDAGLPPIPVSVNISAVEFRSNGFLKNIVDILKETCLDPRYLEIELTESVLMAHVEATNSVLHALKTLGVQLAIDDFGTGWSSLSYLRQFPIDALKVDKSFVQEITSGSSAAPIVSAVISMGRSLKHRVVAEGVETRDQLAFLQAEDCGEGQGYYFSRPLVAQQFARVLETITAPVASHPNP